MKAREAAYQAILASVREEKFAIDSLEEWRAATQPSNIDFRLAHQLAFGTIQMALALDYQAKMLVSKGRLPAKLKEKILLRLSLYQYYFLEKIPLYAIVNESMELAKKYCHPTFVSFLNAFLRKLESTTLNLPKEEHAHALSTRFSYPIFFVQTLLDEYGSQTSKTILQLGNEPAKVMARNRKSGDMIKIESTEHLQKTAQDTNFYIQNATPAHLVQTLAQNTQPPQAILDLCSSPGGKLIAVHDLYPNAKLFANDISEAKVQQLRQNCLKYQIDANITCMPGELYPSEKKFDLIICDVPCSNTGVLNKRPEARWRLSEERLKQLIQKQKQLIAHAISLLTPEGELWYMTCSILSEENEEIFKSFSNLKLRKQVKILPNSDGWDGGFAAALKLNS